MSPFDRSQFKKKGDSEPPKQTAEDEVKDFFGESPTAGIGEKLPVPSNPFPSPLNTAASEGLPSEAAVDQQFGTPPPIAGVEVDDLFADDGTPPLDMDSLKAMTVEVALMKNRIEELKDELKVLTITSGPNKGTGTFDVMARSLHLEIIKNGENFEVKFDNGLKPKPVIVTEYFERKDIDHRDMLQWLRDNNLGDNIKEMVPWKALSGVLKDEVERGNEIPLTLFHKKSTPVIRFGQSLKPFIAKRKEQQSNGET